MKNLNYGIIGNCQSAALISDTGSLDWCCLPAFNSSSVFAKLLDENIGGSFSIANSDEFQISQSYEEDTCILVTHFKNDSGSFEIHDFMPRYNLLKSGYYNPPEIIRYFKLISGEPEIIFLYDPKLEYAQDETPKPVRRLR